MDELAVKMPGYIAHKGFAADDGERLTIVEFESEETMKAWRLHPEHVEAQRKGRSTFYSEIPPDGLRGAARAAVHARGALV